MNRTGSLQNLVRSGRVFDESELQVAESGSF